MKNTYQLQIPKELEQYRSILEESVKPYVKVSGTLAETTLLESKFGGYPYLPIDQEHPKDSNGQPMMLLAQLNLEEIPNIEHMPQHGMLQFFISAEEDLLEQILIIPQAKRLSNCLSFYNHSGFN